MASRPVYINAIGNARGDLVDIFQLVHSHVDERIGRLLQDDGFKYFSRSRNGVAELAVQAIDECLTASRFHPSDVDALIFSSESFGDIYRRSAEVEPRDAIVCGILGGAGLTQAVPYGIWMQGCGNFGSALSLARSLILSRQHHKIVIVLADRASADGNRLAGHGPTVFSDAAVAIVVSGEPRGYEIRALDVLFSHKLARLRSLGNPLLHGKLLGEELRNFHRRYKRRKAPAIKDHDIILIDNFHSMCLSFIYHALQIDKELILSPTKMEGHCFSADCPRSLLYLQESSQSLDDASIALLNIGPAGIAGISLLPVINDGMLVEDLA